MSTQKEKKYAHRLPPCPDYDIEGVESWLTDLAKEGLLLDKDTPFLGFYSFIRTAPQSVKYRLEPAGKAQSLWDGDPGKPKEEAMDIHAEFGWEYITRYGEFFIYRSTDPNARELHTDPDIQAMSLNILKKRQRSAFVTSVVALLIHVFCGILGYPVGMCIALGTPATLAFFLFFTCYLITPVIYIFRLRRIQKKLLNGEPLNRKKDWKSGSLRSRILTQIPTVLGIIVLLSSCSATLGEDVQKVKLSEYTQDPPFATIADLFPEGTYTAEEFALYTNTVREWSDWLFPVNMEWDEFADVRMPDGTTRSGSMDIDYHEAVSPMLAEQLARELMKYANRGSLSDADLEIKTDQIGSVTVYHFTDRNHFRTAILVCENTVVQAQFIVDNSEENIMETTWIQQMAERLTSSSKEV